MSHDFLPPSDTDDESETASQTSGTLKLDSEQPAESETNQAGQQNGL